MKTVTMSELGANLPIGEERDGRLHKPFEMKPWGMDEELEIGEHRTGDEVSLGKFVSETLATMTTVLGGQSFVDVKRGEKLRRIGQLSTGDILYMYSYLRRDALGNELLMDIVCDKCTSDRKFSFVADMDTLRVDILETDKPEDYLKKVVLKRGMEIRREVRKELWVAPTRWFITEEMGGTNGNPAAIKKEMFRNAIIGAEGIDERFIVNDSELRTLRKVDIEILAESMEQNMYGPDFTVEGIHEKCKASFERKIDWSYDSFFRVSSQ